MSNWMKNQNRDVKDMAAETARHGICFPSRILHIRPEQAMAQIRTRNDARRLREKYRGLFMWHRHAQTTRIPCAMNLEKRRRRPSQCVHLRESFNHNQNGKNRCQQPDGGREQPVGGAQKTRRLSKIYRRRQLCSRSSSASPARTFLLSWLVTSPPRPMRQKTSSPASAAANQNKRGIIFWAARLKKNDRCGFRAASPDGRKFISPRT